MAGDQGNQANQFDAKNGILSGTISYGSNGGTVDGFLAMPDDHQPHPGVILVQEWWGIDTHVQELAERLATKGYIVLAPDLYHGVVVHEPNEAEKAMMQLDMPRAVAELGKGLDYLASRNDVQPKKVGVVGFCMGGVLAWQTAIANDGKVGAVAPFYAGGFDLAPEEAAKITAPLLVVFGSQDDSTPPEVRAHIEQVLQSAGKNYKILTYQAGHAFMNPQHGALVPSAAQRAWDELIAFFKQNL